MTPIDHDSVLLDTQVANDFANILAEDETSTIEMAIDKEWTLIIDIERHSSNTTKRMLIAETLWEAAYNA